MKAIILDSKHAHYYYQSLKRLKPVVTYKKTTLCGKSMNNDYNGNNSYGFDNNIFFNRVCLILNVKYENKQIQFGSEGYFYLYEKWLIIYKEWYLMNCLPL